MTQKRLFWNTFLKTLETEPREVASIKGASRLDHHIIALGTDDKSNRVVVISGESDPRYVAMAQSDIQAAYPSTQILFARPVPIDLSSAAQIVTTILGKITFGKEDIPDDIEKSPETQKRLEEIFETSSKSIIPSMKMIYENVPLNLVAAWKEIIQQLSLIEISEDNVDFSKLIAIDPTNLDLKLGICSIPIFSFSEEEIELFNRGVNLDDTKNILRSKDIIQYFFPPVDNLVLALAEKKSASISELIRDVQIAPEIGHPLAENELISSKLDLVKTIKTLMEMDYLVEGSVGVSLGSKGEKVRTKLKFKPREGFISKLLSRISINIDFNLKDLFG
jgi:hypothetical protein